ncbi:toll/interleukin-1 receptor domain-containing protein [Synechococcus sp. PCC 7336]|uniref:toll/interleukin-1 receptor domain-containing protein n=1 Tax=Synechococcus sp. PCC 7336 TaxID=195250 RepID=UPI00034C65CE|nr:toll/interleukin-1 receptor domain-containing protein [Synechococcus sp. PCC 7336]
MEKKFFISWSGEISCQVARAFNKWLPEVTLNAKPFLSSEDIEKGQNWFLKIEQELQDAHFGIICITPDNIDSKWLNFEAGALLQSQDKRVMTFLLGLENSQLHQAKSPLAFFQSTQYSKDDIQRLVKALNNIADSPLSDSQIQKLFNSNWNDLKNVLDPLLREVSRKIVFLLESEGRNVTEQIEAVESHNLGVIRTLVFEKDELPPLDSIEAIVYFYDRTESSSEKFHLMIDRLKKSQQKVKLIVYVEGVLSNEEIELFKSYQPPKISNMASTLATRMIE